MKNLRFWYLLIFILSIGSNSGFAGARYWTNATGNRQWKDPLNWLDSFGSGAKTVPVYPDDAGIYGGSPIPVAPPILGGAVPAVQTLYIGYWGAGTGILNISSGDSLSLSYLSVGSTNYGNYPGIVNLSGGSLMPSVSTLIGNGAFNMTGGTFVTGTLSIANEISTVSMHMDGGIASVGALTIGNYGHLDFTAGTMIIDGNAVSTVNGYVTSGKITAYSGVGRVFVDYGNLNAGKTTVTGLRSKLIAWDPSPAAKGSVRWGDADSIMLEWAAGDVAAFHDVYVGTDFNAVNLTAATDISGVYRGRQNTAVYAPQPLAQDTTYYWRIDEVTAGGTIAKGDVWSFTVGLAERDLCSDTWVATDALDRTLSDYSQCGSLRANKIVGIFYFIWHQWGTNGASDVSKIIAAHPFTYPTNPWYDNPDFGPQFTQWWGEPEAGYFVATDTWVIRRNMSMLANAGVDVLFIDATNAIVYWQELYALCDVMRQMRFEGNKTPQLCFLTHAYSPQTVTLLYNNFYAANAYPELWFYWQGKPLMLGYPDGIDSDSPKISVSDTIRNFFTWRESWAWDPGYHKWQWLDTSPQRIGYDAFTDKAEEVPVGIASHATNNIGRSNQSGVQPGYNQYHLPVAGTQGQGLYFAEQWQRGLMLDPNVIFITGWNEWVASWWKDNGSSTFLGLSVPTGGYYFVDAYNQEYSRDAEPMKGGFTDNYYYQMADNIRKFKGVRAPLATSGTKLISIDGDFSDWVSVLPEFRDMIGDTAGRNSPGQGSLVYTNTTGRNDFADMKVARDDNYIYFYAQCRNTITSYTDPNWMLLFIDADQNHTTGWEGYDYLVNLGVISSTTTTLRQTTGGWNWTLVSSTVSCRVSGNMIELAILRTDLGETSGDVKLDFHWADNIQKTNDIIEFALSGDSAPDRRFNYRYDTSVGDKACDRVWADGQGKAMDLDIDCDFDIDDLDLFAQSWLSSFTLVNFAALADDWLESYLPESLMKLILLSDDFETGNFSKYSWQSSGNKPWTVVSSGSYNDIYSAKSGAIAHNQTSGLSIQVNVAAASILSFHFKVSSELNYDYFRFYIDNIEQTKWSGTASPSGNMWLYKQYSVNSGAHTFKWVYSKDNSVSSGSDCVWIDDIRIVTVE